MIKQDLTHKILNYTGHCLKEKESNWISER